MCDLIARSVELAARRCHPPRMRLVFLYGPPGVGKFSVATELVALTGFKLFHNHVSVNLVASVFPRGSAGWVRLLHRIRRETFAEVAREAVDLVFTCVYWGAPDHAEAVRDMLEPIPAAAGVVLFVQLTCTQQELLARVQSRGRLGHAKLTDPQVASELLHTHDLSAAMPFEPTLRIDTTDLSPAEVAARIVGHYSLPRLSAKT